MARARITAKTLTKFSKDTIDALQKKLTSPQARANLTKLVKPFIADEIAIAIGGPSKQGNSVAAKAFQPLKQPDAEDIVGRLGVGKQGNPDRERLANAWKQLLPSKDGSGQISNVIGSFAGRGSSFGRFGLSINKEAFYKTRLSTFQYFSENESVKIDWMRHYIEGVQIPLYGFAKPGSKSFNRTQRTNTAGQFKNISRTGLGFLIKIPSGAFQIRPRSPDPFTVLQASIARRFKTKEFATRFKKILQRHLRRF